jgi:hypothetical protein
MLLFLIPEYSSNLSFQYFSCRFKVPHNGFGLGEGVNFKDNQFGLRTKR